MARVLILSASVGAGHTRAAQAVELAVRATAPGVETRHVDMMEMTSAVFRRVYREGYFDVIRVAPHLAGMLYDLSDRARPEKPAKGLARLVQKANFHKFYEVIEEPWDLVICTHFLGADLLSQLRRRGKFKTPVVSVVTDFDAHALWATEPTDRYFVASIDAQLALQHWGVPPVKIEITGIPIHPVFSERKTVEGCREKHGLRRDRPCVLVLSGGCGVGPVEQVVRAVLEAQTPLQLVVLCGKNEKLKAQIAKVKAPAQHALRLMGFTTEIDELLRASDLVVSKPGGLTTSEVLATGAAMAIINPIPGQESRNSDMLLEAGAAIKINSPAQATEKVSRLLGDPARLAKIRANAKALGKPRAAFVVAEKALGEVK